MIVELPPVERVAHDAGMPPIFTTQVQRDSGLWPETFYPDRIEWYTMMVIEDGGVRGGVLIIPEFIAAMICESNLQNRIFGDSDKTKPNFGVGWCQFDTAYHVPTIDALHAIRADPLYSLKYILNPVNDLSKQGGRKTHFTKQAWNAWEDRIIDPLLDENGNATGWSALGAAYDAWKKVTDT